MTSEMNSLAGQLRRRMNDYARWHELQKYTQDIDPAYPVYRYVIRDQELGRDDAAWLILLHVNYYHMGSALRAFELMPEPSVPKDELLRLPTGTERRGHRDWRQMERHWLALLEKFEEYGGPWAWLTAAGTDWHALQDHLVDVRGNGRWAAYKLGEMAQKLLGLQTVIADAGHAHSSGPRKGLQDLHPQMLPTDNSAESIAILDHATEELAALLNEPDIGYVETSLCDFHSLLKGGYYLGHDIDAMQMQLCVVQSGLRDVAWQGRALTLPYAYLGERHDWLGVDRERNAAYRNGGQILER